MHKVFLLLPLIALTLSTASAHAAKLTCTNSANVPNASLYGYDFSILVQSSGGGGGGGAVGKAISTLTVQLPLSTSYAQLSQLVSTGRSSSTCVLLDPASTTAPGQVEITMRNVIFTQIQLLSGPVFNPGRSATTVQLTLSYQSYTTTQN